VYFEVSIAVIYAGILREGIGMGAVCIINLLKDTGEEYKVSCYDRGGRLGIYW
jgi:hypothetical protein